MPRPLIIAHRSMTPGAVENAGSAIRPAVEAGADLIEIDVRLSLDRRPVLMHDAFLDRVTMARGWVRLWPSFVLGRIPLLESAEREAVASLKTVLQAFPASAQIALHLKDRAALPSVLKAIKQVGNPGRTWLWLEHMEDIRLARRRLPELRITFLRPAGWTPSNRSTYFTEAQWYGASAVSVPWGVVDRGLVDHAHRHHLLVFSRLERMADLHERVGAGLDGVITEDPAGVSRFLDSSGV